MGSVQTMFRSLRHRNFRLFFSGQIVSLVGTWMQQVAQSWLIYRLSHSAALLGVATFVNQIPALLLSPVGGVVADRYDRRRILVWTQTASMVLAMILAALTLNGVVQVWHIMVLAVLLGVSSAFDTPARQSFIVDMVERQDVSNSIALNSVMYTVARTLGPAVAGVLVSLMGEGWCFAVNGLSYVAVIVGLLMMRIPMRISAPLAGSPFSHVAEGFRYVWRTGPVRSLLWVMGLSCLVAVPYQYFMPIFADQILHGGPRGMGWLMAAAGTGALVGALVLSLRTELNGMGALVARYCFTFGISLAAFSLSQSFYLSMALLVVLGFAMTSLYALINTLIQSMIPDELRGRVMSFYFLMYVGTTPFGTLLAGSLAKPLGVPRTLTCGGLICAAGGVVFWLGLDEFRTGARRLIDGMLPLKVPP